MSHEDVTVGFPIVGKRYIVSIFETLDERYKDKQDLLQLQRRLTKGT